MPTSHYSKIPIVFNQIEQVWPFDSMLDIGPGFGKFGLVARERYDVRFKRYDRKDWQLKLDCVEIYGPYITPAHEFIYNSIYIGDIYNTVAHLKDYDVVMMIDCLEHLEKKDGEKVVEALGKITKKLLIFSFPSFFKGNEGRGWPNQYELHRCLWTKEDLEAILGPVHAVNKTIFTKQFV